MAEGFFQHHLKNHHSPVTVTSAGISALVDHPADSDAHLVMQSHGIDLSHHRARQITEPLAREADLILVMTQAQYTLLTRQFLFTKGKTFLLGQWQNFEIQDPYKQPYEAFEKVYLQISLAWQDWKTRI